MSEKTLAAMEQAIADHFADEKNAHYGDFLIVVSGVSYDEEQNRTRAVYAIEHNDQIAPHVMLGLMQIMSNNIVVPAVNYAAEDIDYED